MPKTLLSRRQAQVLELILKAQTNAAIAQRLGISVPTVKMHCRMLFVKYGIGGVSHDTARVRLAVKATYERRPDLVPFCDGDRAASLGRMSAQEFAKANTEPSAGAGYSAWMFLSRSIEGCFVCVDSFPDY